VELGKHISAARFTDLNDSAASHFGHRSTQPRVDLAAGWGTEKWLMAYKLKALIFLKRDEIALRLHF